MRRKIDWPATLTVWVLVIGLFVFWYHAGHWLLELLRRLASPA